MTDIIRIVCWNIARSREAIDRLPDFNADVALLQEVSPQDWDYLRSYSYWDRYLPTFPAQPYRAEEEHLDHWPAVVQLTGRNYIRSLTHVGPEAIPRVDDLPSWAPGITAGARIIPGQGRPHFTVISAYARYNPDPDVPDERSPRNANRQIQLDVTTYAYFEPDQRPVILAGDFNCNILPTNPKPWEIPNVFTTYPQSDFHYVGPDDLPHPTSPVVQRTGATRTPVCQPIDAHHQHGHVFVTPHFDGVIAVTLIPNDDLPGNHLPILIEVGI